MTRLNHLNNAWYDFSNMFGSIRFNMNSITLHTEYITKRKKRYWVCCRETYKATKPMTAHQLTVVLRKAVDDNINLLAKGY